MEAGPVRRVHHGLARLACALLCLKAVGGVRGDRLVVSPVSQALRLRSEAIRQPAALNAIRP